jgi:multisubunit Na+/H+ antiporter MnhE subunit
MPARDRPSAHSDSIARDAPPGRAELARVWLVWWVLCAALWLVLDDTLALPELVDGAIAAAIGASAATLVRARSHVQFAVQPGWTRHWWRPFVHLVSDLPELTRTLAHAVAGGNRDPGRIRAVDFSVHPDARARAAQVALASVVGSVAPSTVIIAVDEEGGQLIFHELIPRDDRQRADPLELG